jgi:hypothetical protein
MADPWPLIHAEREALADDWATGSGPEVSGPLLSLIRP